MTPSSSKSQAHDVTVPVEASVNPTASGASPLVALAVKSAVGTSGSGWPMTAYPDESSALRRLVQRIPWPWFEETV